MKKIFTDHMYPLRRSGDEDAGVMDEKYVHLAVTPPDAECAETPVSLTSAPSCGIEGTVATPVCTPSRD